VSKLDQELPFAKHHLTPLAQAKRFIIHAYPEHLQGIAQLQTQITEVFLHYYSCSLHHCHIKSFASFLPVFSDAKSLIGQFWRIFNCCVCQNSF